MQNKQDYSKLELEIHHIFERMIELDVAASIDLRNRIIDAIRQSNKTDQEKIIEEIREGII